MTIQTKLPPTTILRFATGAALAGLAASARNPSGTGRGLLQQGVPPGTEVNPPPAPQVSPPPVSVSPPPPAAPTPTQTPGTTPPATQAVPPSPTQTPGTTPPASPPSASGVGVPTVSRAGITECPYIDNPNIDANSLYCFLECQSAASACEDVLAVRPGPNPQAGMVWCPFLPDTWERMYQPIADCSNNCHELLDTGLQGGRLTLPSDWVGRICYGYDYLAGAAQIINSRAIVGPVTMTTNHAMCLDTTGGGNAAGTLVNILHCNGQASQQWSLEYEPNTLVYQQLKSNGMCLDVVGGALVANAFLKIAECDPNSQTQGWGVSEQSNEIYAINSGQTLCVDTLGGLDYDYISAVLTTCNRDVSTPTQRWDI